MVKRNEYFDIYGYDDDDGRNYEELYENEDPDDAVERLRGSIGRGDCLYCGTKNGMKYEGHICFVCTECGKSVHEDVYYRWAAGYPIEFED